MPKKTRKIALQSRPRVLVALGYNMPNMQRGIAAYAHRAGWVLDTTMSRYGVFPEYWRGDGILAFLLPGQTDLTKKMRRIGCPVVTLNVDAPFGVCGATFDHQATGRMVAEYFVRCGLEHLAFFRCSNLVDVRERQDAFLDAARAAGRSCEVIDWRPKQSVENIDLLTERIAAMKTPMGILSQSDHRSPQLFEACERAGRSIPGEISVIGVDNDEMTCEFAPVALSSVDTNQGRLGWEAAAVLDRIINGHPSPKQPVSVPPLGIIHRRSSDLLAIRHEGVALALRYIWHHFREPINANVVIDKVPMSRCGLYRAFETHVGHSIGEELLRVRVDYAKRQLIETDDKMLVIARKAGFTSGEHFSKSFSRAVGIAPSEYRTQNAVISLVFHSGADHDDCFLEE